MTTSKGCRTCSTCPSDARSDGRAARPSHEALELTTAANLSCKSWLRCGRNRSHASALASTARPGYPSASSSLRNRTCPRCPSTATRRSSAARPCSSARGCRSRPCWTTSRPAIRSTTTSSTFLRSVASRPSGARGREGARPAATARGVRGSGRVLLAESVPRRLRRDLPGLVVSTVPDEGWASRRNGELPRPMLAAGSTGCVTMDRTLAYQQEIAAAGVAVVVLRACTNRLRDRQPLVPRGREAVAASRPGTGSHVAGQRVVDADRRA